MPSGSKQTIRVQGSKANFESPRDPGLREQMYGRLLALQGALSGLWAKETTTLTPCTGSVWPGRSVGRSVGRLVGWLVGWLVGGLVGWWVRGLVGWCWSIGRLVGSWVGWLVLVDWSVGRSVGRSVGWLVGRSVGRSIGRWVAWLPLFPLSPRQSKRGMRHAHINGGRLRWHRTDIPGPKVCILRSQMGPGCCPWRFPATLSVVSQDPSNRWFPFGFAFHPKKVLPYTEPPNKRRPICRGTSFNNWTPLFCSKLKRVPTPFGSGPLKTAVFLRLLKRYILQPFETWLFPK